MFVMSRRTWQLLNCKASADLQPCRTVQRFSRNQHIGRTSRSITAHRLCGIASRLCDLPHAAIRRLPSRVSWVMQNLIDGRADHGGVQVVLDGSGKRLPESRNSRILELILL